MSYYLGKVGRAGARLVHSCRELYNDVNAAYLTGAVDVLVVRQRDGTLKSTPFHARFGKLGVLRTGDFKEVGETRGGQMGYSLASSHTSNTLPRTIGRSTCTVSAVVSNYVRVHG